MHEDQSHDVAGRRGRHPVTRRCFVDTGAGRSTYRCTDLRAAAPARRRGRTRSQRCPTSALRSDHVLEAAHTAPHSPGGRRRWDGSHFAVPKSPLQHLTAPIGRDDHRHFASGGLTLPMRREAPALTTAQGNTQGWSEQPALGRALIPRREPDSIGTQRKPRATASAVALGFSPTVGLAFRQDPWVGGGGGNRTRVLR
jgi:hypothetical protein